MIIHPTVKPPRHATEILAVIWEAVRSNRPVELLASEEPSVIAHLRWRKTKLLRQIRIALEKNDLRAARRRARRFLSNSGQRLLALHEAHRAARKPRQSRDLVSPVDECRATRKLRPLRDLAPLVQQVDVLRRWPKGRQFPLEKLDRPGHYRDVTSFGPLDRACSILIKAVLTEFARAHPTLSCDKSQALLFGGRPVACERLHTALRALDGEGWFAHLDVQSFFPSIAAEKLWKALPLDPRIIQRHIAASGSLRGHNQSYTGRDAEGSAWTHSSRARDETEGGHDAVRTGVVQGAAASSSAAEMVMGRFRRGAGHTDGVVLTIIYSDNIGVLATSEAAARTAIATLSEELQEFDGGPFQVRHSLACTGRGFRYLGYCWHGHGDVVVVCPAEARQTKFELRIGEEVRRLAGSGCQKLALRLKRKVKAWVSGYPLWRDGEHFSERLCGEIDATVLSHARDVMASRPIQPLCRAQRTRQRYRLISHSGEIEAVPMALSKIQGPTVSGTSDRTCPVQTRSERREAVDRLD